MIRGAFKYLLSLFFVLCFRVEGSGMPTCGERIVYMPDPGSSASLLMRELDKRKIPAHGILSGSELPEWAQTSFYMPEGSIMINEGGDREKILAALRERHPEIPPNILPGADGEGLLLRDFLTNELGVRGNTMRLSLARRYKDLTQLALKDANLPYVRGLLTGDLKKAFAFADSVGGYPIWIKPNDDGGSNDVFKVRDAEALERAFTKILSSTNETTNKKNAAALLQEHVPGREFAVQGVVRDGHTKFSSVLQYYKVPIEGHADLYKSEWIVDPLSDDAITLMNFFRLANPALELENGPFHWESKLKRAIELNGRLAGGGLPEFFADCIGYGDIDLTIEAWFFPEEFARRPDVYSLPADGYGFRYFPHTPKAGMRLNQAFLATAAAKTGFIRARPLTKLDLTGPLPKTFDMHTLSIALEYKGTKESSREVLDWLTEQEALGAFFE